MINLAIKLVEEQISEIRQSMIDRYLNEKIDDLSRDLSIEENDVNGYHSREILELLQNIDDAYELSVQSGTALTPVEAEISFINGVLKVSNTGTSFDEEGIKSIVLGHLSTKDKTLIGNKGSGFRGVLNWSNDIKIYSGQYSVGFSKKYADSEFDKVKNINSIDRQNQIRKKRGEKALSFPIFSMPFYIPQKDIGKYSTTIEIVIDDEKNKDDFNVVNQLKEFDHRTLLFLPNLSKLTIIIENEVITLSKTIEKHDSVSKVRISNQLDLVEEFFVLKKLIDKKNSNKQIIIAAPTKSLESYPVYCYFPTKQYFSLPLLVHAPFILSQDRNRITTDINGHNKAMFMKVLDESILLATELTKIQEDREFPLFILTPNALDRYNWGFNDVIKDFNLLDYYLNNLSEAKVIPLRNGGFTDVTSGIKIFEVPTPSFFTGEGFELLLENISNERSFSFVKRLLSRKNISTYFESGELIKILNKKVQSLEQRVETFIWWSNSYPKIISIPNVIEIDGEFITNTNGERIFLPSQDGIGDLPLSLKSHVKLKIISQDFVDLLIERLKKTSLWAEIQKQYTSPSDKRILDKYSEEKLSIRFNEQSSREMIIREINNQVTTHEISVEFVKWLFNLYKNGDLTSQSLKEISFNFPVKNGVKKSSEIYLGSRWNNHIADYLFNKEKYQELVGNEILDISTSEMDLFVNFAREFGVSQYPIFTLRRADYFDFKITIGKTHARYIYSFTCDDFEELIKTLDTEIIVQWIKYDSYLSSIIPSIEENSYAQLQSNSYHEKFRSNAYILYILNSTKWININGVKYAPIDIVLFEKLADLVHGFYGISRTNLRKLVGEMLFGELDFRKTFADLSDSQLKVMINKMSNISDRIISPKLYDDIVRGKRDQKPINSEYKPSEFKVLCKDGQYYKTSEVWYADKIVPRVYTSDSKNHFIYISPKLSTKTILDWFGVKKFEIELKFKSYVPLDNKKIEKDIKELKIALLSSMDQNNNNIENMKKLRIIPSFSLTVTDEYNNEIIIEDEYYHVFSSNNVAYLKIPNNYDQLKIAPLLTDIFRNVFVYNFDDSKIQLLIMLNKSQKIDYITSEYGVDKWYITEESLYKDTINQKKIIEFFKNHNLSKDQISLLNTINFDSYIKYDEYPILIESLRTIQVDIIDLNNLDIFPHIDIRPYWQKQLDENLVKWSDSYKSKVYLTLIEKDINDKKEFIDLINKFISFEYSFDNSVYISVQTILENSFNFVFDSTQKIIDVDEIYKKNYEYLDLKDNQMDDFISDNNQMKSLVYFISDEIIEYLKSNFVKRNPTDDKLPGDRPEDEKQGKIVDKLVIPIVKNKKIKKEKNSLTGKSKSQRNKENQQKEVNGKQAEEFAYELLLEKYPNLKWTSENAYSHLPERNTSTSNDMYYVNSSNEKVLIEIKSSTGSFFMSSAEYELARLQGKLYEIWLVDTKNKQINGPKFIKDFESSKEATEYKFSYTTPQFDNE